MEATKKKKHNAPSIEAVITGSQTVLKGQLTVTHFLSTLNQICSLHMLKIGIFTMQSIKLLLITHSLSSLAYHK